MTWTTSASSKTVEESRKCNSQIQIKEEHIPELKVDSANPSVEIANRCPRFKLDRSVVLTASPTGTLKFKAMARNSKFTVNLPMTGLLPMVLLRMNLPKLDLTRMDRPWKHRSHLLRTRPVTLTTVWSSSLLSSSQCKR
ncbi:hypothetical protein BGZ47_011089 [Haplosporangium gracile]|nr:hypothetical protein BGZ47_011089 [Haplosporangium gracile]